MRDISLDQLLVFINVSEHGSFSAAARHLHRAQSAISYAIANLEEQLEVELFDRSRRKPRLTPAGEALLVDAREVVERVDLLSARARGFSEGIEPKIGVAVHMVFPLKLLVNVLNAFNEEFPSVSLVMHSEILGGVTRLVEEGKCDIGISSAIDPFSHTLSAEPIAAFPTLPVAAPDHPLVSIGEEEGLDLSVVAKHTQIVVRDRYESTPDREFGVLSEHTWRVADVHTKVALLKGGLGWGHIPVHLVHDELIRGELVPLHITGAENLKKIPIYGIHRTSEPPGPAGRWLLENLTLAAREAVQSCQAMQPDPF